jgi:signal transduction histidine kinase
MIAWFFAGIGVGVLLATPLVWLAMRRTERRVRQLEQRAAAAERLAELGTLTGGLAHEIKNPLSSVNLNIQLLQEDFTELARQAARAAEAGASPPACLDADKLGRIQRRCDALAREVHRLRQILEDFLRFAGRVKLELTRTDLNELIRELVDFYAPQAQALGVTVRTQLAEGDLLAPADGSLLKQALLNLMINACQAMAAARAEGKPHGGATDLIIRSERESAAGQMQAVIHITDTGPGISADHLSKIFQPYFSTKKGGTGLGLPTARRIIEEHGGTLTVHSEPGTGSDFVVTLKEESDKG